MQAAPLLCAGLIGYRSYRQAMDAKSIALYGFGAAAHILIQIARHRNQAVYAFTREGDAEAQQFAMELGADWAGDSSQRPHLFDRENIDVLRFLPEYWPPTVKIPRHPPVSN